MKLIDNVTNRLGDDLKASIKKGSKLSIAASSFSIYAYEALRKELERIDELRFIFTTPTFNTAKQKKLFTDLIARITWTHKLSSDTINLEARDIKEIQVFKVELKVKQEIQPVLDIIDKAIPYTIIFVVEHDTMIYISTSSKHPHPIKEDNAVIDWTFKSEWFQPAQNKYTLQLKKSIDAIHHDFCIQLSGKSAMTNRPLQDLIGLQKNVVLLEKEIARLKSAISGAKQFKNKVDLNLKLKAKENELKLLVCES